MQSQLPSKSSAAAAPPQSEGRPRALNGARRNELFELVSEGFSLAQAARQIRCSVRTIQREMKRDQIFADEIRRCEKFSQANPLQALKRAIHHNWRAAAWLLERMFPERFARRPRANPFGKRQVRQLLDEVLQIVDAELQDKTRIDRIQVRIRAAFEYCLHVYSKSKRSRAGLRRAIDWFEQKNHASDPATAVAPFPDESGFRGLEQWLMSQAPPVPDTASQRRQVRKPEPSMTELVEKLMADLPATDSPTTKPNPSQPASAQDRDTSFVASQGQNSPASSSPQTKSAQI